MNRSLPLLPTAALLLALVGQAAAIVHLGVVRHVRCAEHGELVEVGAHGGADHERFAVDVIGAGDVGHEDDDHCDLAFRVARVPDVSVAVKDKDVAVSLAVVAAGLRPADGVAPHGVLDVAPKTSPPRA